MHLSFVPLTADKRLSAKEILGNKKKLTQWQDSFWRHMVKKYPELERGESASLTGRTHIPPRIYKEAVRLGKQQQMLMALLSDIHPLNAKKRAAEIEELLKQSNCPFVLFVGTKKLVKRKVLRLLSKERWRFKHNDPSNWCAPKMAKCIETSHHIC